MVWTYTGLEPTDMASRVTTYSEFALSNNVNGIKRMESTTLQGVTIERIYFQDSVTIDLAVAQVVAATNSVRAVMPPGINPPVIMQFAASSVPVIQLALTSTSETLAQIYDYAQYRIRQTLTQVPGSTLPSPYGGSPRQIMVDLDLNALRAYGLTPLDVTNAITAQNPVEPSGLAKIGDTQYPIRLNTTPEAIASFNDMPIKVVHGSPVLIRDVAYVRDGSPPQQNVVRSNGQAAVLETVLKNGTASTLSVVDTVKNFLSANPRRGAQGHEGDAAVRSVGVRVGAIGDVIREALIAAALTGAMILLFLGSWRSMLIVLVSIPLSILTSLIVLTALGETINIMTLGGLALAVGILVDDATVAIENTYRLMEEKKPFREAVVEGAAGIATPALISTLAICSAFVSVFFLTDTPKYLFTPQALAVVFAMLASYGLSRTLVPILIDVLVATEYAQRYPDAQEAHEREPPAQRPPSGMGRLFARIFPRRSAKSSGARRPGFFARAHARFEHGFEAFRKRYLGTLNAVMGRPIATFAVAMVVLHLRRRAGALHRPGLFSADQLQHDDAACAHAAGHADRDGDRGAVAAIEKTIREIIPRKGSRQRSRQHRPARQQLQSRLQRRLVRRLQRRTDPDLAEGRARLDRELHAATCGGSSISDFPTCIFYFQPADIITQILDFGTLTPIDIQVSGPQPRQGPAKSRRISSAASRARAARSTCISSRSPTRRSSSPASTANSRWSSGLPSSRSPPA